VSDPGRRAAAGGTPPNIVMVVADQERSDVLGCYGSRICRTPNLDRLAAEGVRFETCLAPTAICSPSRASLLTGRYPHGHGILNNTHEADALRLELPEGMPTYSQLLHDAGYRLGYVGKWHVGRYGPRHHGFDDLGSVPEDAAAEIDQESIGADTEAIDPIYAHYPRGRLLVAGIDPRPPDATESHADASAAIELLERYAALEQPFFMRLDFEGPHHPYLPPQPYADLYDPAAIPPWPNFDEDASRKPAAQARLLEQRGVVGWTWADWAPVVARYFGFETFIDAEIGRVLDALEGLSLSESTVVIHTADHGDMTGSHGGQFNKGPLGYDEIYRIPLIARGPGIEAGGVRRAPVASLALMPTILELAGVPIPDGLHAESLVPRLRDTAADPDDDAAFAEYHGEEWGLYSMRIARTRDAKYVYAPHGTDELYDLTNDPHERQNVAAEPANADLLAQMRDRLRDWMVRTDDPLALWASRVL
jgi:arylsulfatase A-like enzyme